MNQTTGRNAHCCRWRKKGNLIDADADRNRMKQLVPSYSRDCSLAVSKANKAIRKILPSTPAPY